MNALRVLTQTPASNYLGGILAPRKLGLYAARTALIAGSVVTLGLVGSPPLIYVSIVLLTALSIPAVMIQEERGSRFRYWALYFLAFICFAHLRSFADSTGMPIHFLYALEWDAAIFGVVPTVWLQEHLYRGANGWLEIGTVAVHLSYFLMPHLLGLFLLGRPKLLRHYALSVGGTLTLGLILYYLVPTAPPWLAAETGILEGPVRVITELGAWSGYDNFSRVYQLVGEPNAVAAMPSLHTALTALVAFAVARMGRLRAITGYLYLFLMGFSLVYLGEHYVVDVLAGIAVAWLAWKAAGRSRLAQFI